MQQVPFSTTAVEQAHASLATISKYHRQLNEANLINRSYIHQLRMTFRAKPTSSLSCRLEKQLNKLSRANPDRISGRNLFLRDAMEAMVSTLGRATPSQSDVRSVISKHGSVYAELPAEVPTPVLPAPLKIGKFQTLANACNSGKFPQTAA